MTKRQEPKFVIPYGDWEEEYLLEEPDISSKEAIVTTQMGSNISPQKMGRLVLVGRERGDTPAGVISPNKMVLNAGAAREISQIFSSYTRTVEAPSGSQYEARAFIGPVGSDEGDEIPEDETFVDLHDPKALERACQYLERRIPGHIWGRLVIIMEHKGDVQAAVSTLHDKIDEMVSKLVEPDRP